jgi:hypothetical protein
MAIAMTSMAIAMTSMAITVALPLNRQLPAN